MYIFFFILKFKTTLFDMTLRKVGWLTPTQGFTNFKIFLHLAEARKGPPIIDLLSIDNYCCISSLLLPKHGIVLLWIPNITTYLRPHTPNTAWGLSCGEPRILIFNRRIDIITFISRYHCYQPPPEETTVRNLHWQTFTMTDQWHPPPPGETYVTTHHLKTPLF